MPPEPFDLARQGHLGALGQLLDPIALIEEHDREDRSAVGDPHLHDHHLRPGTSQTHLADAADDGHLLTHRSPGDRLHPRAVEVLAGYMEGEIGNR